MRHALDTARPERLVELRVDADVLGAHRLLRKVDYGLDGMRRPLLERAAVHTLVQVDGVFTRDDVLEGRACLAGLACHCIADCDEFGVWWSMSLISGLCAPFW